MTAVLVSDNGTAETPISDAIVLATTSVGSLLPSSGSLLTNANGEVSFTINGTGAVGAGTVSLSSGDAGDSRNIEVVEPAAQIGTRIDIDLVDDQDVSVGHQLESGDSAFVSVLLVESDGQTDTAIANTIVSASTTVGSILPASGNRLTDSVGRASFVFSGTGDLGAGTITVSSEAGGASNSYAVEIIEAQVELGTRIELTLVDESGTPVSSNIESGTSRTLAIRVLQNDGVEDTPLGDVIVRATTSIGLIVPLRATALTDTNGNASLEIGRAHV